MSLNGETSKIYITGLNLLVTRRNCCCILAPTIYESNDYSMATGS